MSLLKKVGIGILSIGLGACSPKTEEPNLGYNGPMVYTGKLLSGYDIRIVDRMDMLYIPNHQDIILVADNPHTSPQRIEAVTINFQERLLRLDYQDKEGAWITCGSYDSKFGCTDRDFHGPSHIRVQVASALKLYKLKKLQREGTY